MINERMSDSSETTRIPYTVTIKPLQLGEHSQQRRGITSGYLLHNAQCTMLLFEIDI